MYIHMPVLFKILDRSVDRKRSIMGLVAKKWRPVRNNKSKYFLSRNEYKPVLFPDFTTGPAYVITNDVFDALYEASLNGTFFRFEDVYLTGTIADQLGIRRVHLPEFRNSRLKLNPCVVNKIATVHMVNPIEMDVLYKKLQGNLTNCKFPAPKRGEAKIWTFSSHLLYMYFFYMLASLTMPTLKKSFYLVFYKDLWIYS